MLNPWLEKIREKEAKKKKEEEDKKVKDLYDEMAEIWDTIGFSQCMAAHIG